MMDKALSVSVILAVVVIFVLLLLIFSSLIPFGDEHVVSGYLSDISYTSGYGYSSTTVILDNVSYTFDSFYGADVELYRNVSVYYKYCVNPNYRKITRIDIDG